MPIFISYSHADKTFVNKLATHLVRHNAHVWIDSWELNVGDSLIQRIQQAIQESSALLVVLSKASVQSEWCKKELSAGLVRELKKKKSWSFLYWSKTVTFRYFFERNCTPIFVRASMTASKRLFQPWPSLRILTKAALQRERLIQIGLRVGESVTTNIFAWSTC